MMAPYSVRSFCMQNWKQVSCLHRFTTSLFSLYNIYIEYSMNFFSILRITPDFAPVGYQACVSQMQVMQLGQIVPSEMSTPAAVTSQNGTAAHDCICQVSGTQVFASTFVEPSSCCYKVAAIYFMRLRRVWHNPTLGSDQVKVVVPVNARPAQSLSPWLLVPTYLAQIVVGTMRASRDTFAYLCIAEVLVAALL